MKLIKTDRNFAELSTNLTVINSDLCTVAHYGLSAAVSGYCVKHRIEDFGDKDTNTVSNILYAINESIVIDVNRARNMVKSLAKLSDSLNRCKKRLSAEKEDTFLDVMTESTVHVSRNDMVLINNNMKLYVRTYNLAMELLGDIND